MSAVPLPPDEQERLSTLLATRLLDAEVDPAFLALTRQLADRLGCPIGMVNLVAENTVWVLAATGADFKQIPRSEAFCATTVARGASFCIGDTLNDPGFRTFPAAQPPLNLRFYAGAPIMVEGHALGTVCVVDTHARTLSHAEESVLNDFARMASALAEAKLSIQRHRTQEARVRTAGLTSSDWLWETDTNNAVTWVSTSLLQHTGEPPEAELGRQATDIYRGRQDETQPSWDRGLAAFTNRKPFRDAIANRETSRGPIIVNISGTPVFNTAGEFKGYRGSSRNITESYLAEQSRRQADLILRQAIESFHAGVMISDAEGRITLCNRIWRERFGAAIHLQETIWPDILQRCIANGLYPQAKGREAEFLAWRLNLVNDPGAHEIQLKDGWVLAFDQRLPDGGVSHFFIDITESKRNAVALALQRQALQESQGRLTAVLSALPDLWFVLDAEGTYVEGHVGHPMLVRPFEELVGQPLETEVPPEVGRLCRQAIQKAHATGEPQVIEYSLTIMDGSYRRFEARIAPMPDRHTLFLTRDMTDRMEAAEQLRVSEELYRSVASSISDGLMVVQLDGKVVALNPAGCQILGVQANDGEQLTMDDLENHPLLQDDLVTPLPRDEWPLMRTIRTGQAIHGELHPLRRTDGDQLWVTVSTHLLRISPDAPAFAAVVAFRDVTQAHRASQALAQSEERWKFALEGAGDGVWDWDVATNQMYYSSRGKAMLGYEDDEIGDSLDQVISLIHPDDKSAVLSEMDAYLARGEGLFQAEFRMGHKDGRTLWILSRGKIMNRDRDGRPLRVVGTHTDITLLKQAEQVMRDKQMAVAASKAKSEFLSRMSHEIRTPLNAITGFAQLLQLKQDSERASPKEKMFVEQILQAGDHLMALINDVLDLQKVEAGVLTLHMEPMQLADEVRQTIGMLKPMADQKQVVLHNDVPDGLSVIADRQRLRQVLVNLGSNAIKYNRPSGTVHFHVDAASSPHVLQLHVSDTGHGISSDDLLRLFQPFERLGRETSSVEGTGLGLIITRSLVEAMGGSLGIQSTVGQGTSVTMALPLASRQRHPDSISLTLPEPASSPMTPSSVHSASPNMTQALRVLYVEDNRINAMLFEEALRPYNEICLEVAEDGEAALAMAQANEPDVLVLDAHLPGMSGFDVFDALRRDIPSLIGKPAFMCSADAMPDDLARAKAAGFTGYWTKPIDIMEVTTILRGLAAKRDNAHP